MRSPGETSGAYAPPPEILGRPRPVTYRRERGVGSRGGYDLPTKACRSQRLGIDLPGGAVKCGLWRVGEHGVSCRGWACAGWRRRERCARRLPGVCLAQGSERGAHLLGEELGLLPGGEVPTLVDLVEVDDVRV